MFSPINITNYRNSSTERKQSMIEAGCPPKNKMKDNHSMLMRRFRYLMEKLNSGDDSPEAMSFVRQEIKALDYALDFIERHAEAVLQGQLEYQHVHVLVGKVGQAA